jgi:hypothetical protein
MSPVIQGQGFAALNLSKHENRIAKLCCKVSRGRIFSQFENELIPSCERGIWEKH